MASIAPAPRSPASGNTRALARAPMTCLLLLALAPALTGFTIYDSLWEWQAAVGIHELEDFDDVPTQGIPAAGGSIVLDGFTIVSDGNHSSDGDVCFGVCRPKVEDGVFRGDIHGFTEFLNFVRFEFDVPIFAISMDIGEVEDGDISLFSAGGSANLRFDDDEYRFVGLVFDGPITRVSFSVPDFNIFTVDNVRWTTSPEPSTALLFGAGLLGLAAKRRGTVPSSSWRSRNA